MATRWKGGDVLYVIEAEFGEYGLYRYRTGNGKLYRDLVERYIHAEAATREMQRVQGRVDAGMRFVDAERPNHRAPLLGTTTWAGASRSREA